MHVDIHFSRGIFAEPHQSHDVLSLSPSYQCASVAPVATQGSHFLYSNLTAFSSSPNTSNTNHYNHTASHTPATITVSKAQPALKSVDKAELELQTESIVATMSECYFTVDQLIQLACVCADIDVFAATHGKITATWANVGRCVHSLGINYSNVVLCKKVGDLLK